MATKLESVNNGTDGLDLDQVTAQIFEELRRVSVISTKIGNRQFIFSLLGSFVDNYGRDSTAITSAMVTSATIYFPEVSTRSFRPNQICYLVTMTPPMEDAEVQENENVNASEGNGIVKADQRKKGNKPKKILIGAGELVLAQGSLDQIVNSRQLILDCYHPTSTFSGVEVLKVTGEDCLAFSPQAYLTGLLKKQRGLDKYLTGYNDSGRKSSETDWQEEAKRLKEDLRSERLDHNQLSRKYSALEEQVVDLRIAQVATRAEKESQRGQLLYALAQDLVTHLIRKGEYSSEGIVLCPSIEHTPTRVSFDRKLRLSNINDQHLLVFAADVENSKNGKKEANGDTAYPSQSIRYYRGFAETYGQYLGADRFSEDHPLPAIMAKLMEMELRGKEEIPNLTHLLLEKRVAGFTQEHIEQALQANLLMVLSSRGSKYFQWTSVQNTLAAIYPYVERYHTDFAKSKPIGSIIS